MIEPQTNGTVTKKINIKIEKNSKGFNWEVTVTNADTVDEALAMLMDAEQKLRNQYGSMAF